MKRTSVPLNLLLLALLILILCSTTAYGQVAIPFSEINKGLSLGENRSLNILNEKVFIGTQGGLFIVNKDGTQYKKVESIVGKISDIKDVDGQTFIGASETGEKIGTLWTIDKNGDKIERVEAIDGYVNVIEVLEEQVFVGTAKGLFTINKDTHHVEPVNGIAGDVKHVRIVGNQAFVSPDDGTLWIVSKDGKYVKEVKGIKRGIGAIKISDLVGELVFVGTYAYEYKGWPVLYTVSKDGENVEPVKDIQGEVTQIEIVGDKIFVISETPRVSFADAPPPAPDVISDPQTISGDLWIVSKDGKNVEKVKDIRRGVRIIKVVGELIFVESGEIFGNRVLWIVSKDGKNVEKVKDIQQGRVSTVEEVKGQILFGTSMYLESISGGELWIISKDRKQIYSSLNFRGVDCKIEKAGEYVWIRTRKELYIIYPSVEIKTELVGSSWLTSFLDTILPYNLISSGEHEIRAYYVDENGNDPFKGTVKGKFRFLKDEGGAKPSETSFSQQEDFRYKIAWGKNEVKYWVIDVWGNTLTPRSKVYYGVPSQYSFVVIPLIFSVVFVLGCFALAPKVEFAHSAIMNPWLRKYFSLGSVPLLLSVFPALRRHILGRYSQSVNRNDEFTEWKGRFVYPDEEFLPENFGKRLQSERRFLLTGQSGIGKTSFFKHLMAYYVSQDKPKHPTKVFPIYISLMNYGGNSLEELVYTQLFSYGKITDRELAPMFLEQGGLLIFLDGVNEVQNISDRQKLAEFVEKFWTSNYICLSSQQSYPEIENIPKVELKAFGLEQVREFIRQRVNDKETAERVIKTLTDEDYQLYSVPRDLEFAVEILNNGAKSLPKSRTELYKIIFSSIFDRWKQKGNMDAEDTLCERAYRMIVEREMAFDSAERTKFKEISEDLFKQKFLVKREGSYNFRHDLIRAYLASEFFYPRWKNLFRELNGKPIDSNWLEMLKFSCENISAAGEVKNLVYEVLEKSVRKDLVKSLFRWLKDNYLGKCSSWETDFYAKYGESDFK